MSAMSEIRPMVDITLTPSEAATGVLSSNVNHFGDAPLKSPAEIISREISLAQGAPAPISQDWQGIIADNSAASQAALSGFDLVNLSHLDQMSDDTLQSVMDGIDAAPRASSKGQRRSLQSIPKYVPQAIVAGAGSVMAVAVAPSITNEVAVAQDPSVAPEQSIVPVESIDPNGETAQGEVPCETDVQPAAQVAPDASIVPGEIAMVGNTNPVAESPAPVAESPAPLPTGGDLLGGDPGVDPNCTPEASPTPEVAENPYTIEAFLELGYDPINIKEFEKKLKKLAPSLFKNPTLADRYETEDDLVEYYMNGFKELIATPSMTSGGSYLATSVSIALNDASAWFATDPEISKANYNFAVLIRGLAHAHIDFDTENPKKIDKKFDDLVVRNHS